MSNTQNTRDDHAPLLVLRDDDSTLLSLSDADDVNENPTKDSLDVPPSLRPLLIVDDEEMLLQILGKLFRGRYDVRLAHSGAVALEFLNDGFRPEVIIADQRMPGMSGPEFLAQSRSVVPQAVRIILTGYTDVNDVIDSINLGYVYRFITKPWNPDELSETIRLGFEHYDITTRNKELADALRQLEELDREKSEIMGIVAHDLKNPIGSVRLMAEMIMADNTMTAEETDEFIKLIYDASERALEFISRLLSLDAIERGTVALHLHSTNVVQVAENIVKQYIIPAQKKNITIHWTQTEPLFAIAEEATLRQVLDNLISNAVKYSPHGKNIWITASDRLLPEEFPDDGKLQPQAGSIALVVRDEGPGLTDDDKIKMFGKFTRLSAQPTGDESSTGLGLSIVKRFVEAMHGRIWVVSELGQGARFVVALPPVSATN